MERGTDNVAGKRRTNDFCYFWGVNYLLIILGAVSLGLGVTGMFLPVLPTTPPRLGPYIRDFQEHRCISRKVKAVSIVTLWLTIILSIILVHHAWLRILLAAIAVGVTVHILSFTTKNQ